MILNVIGFASLLPFCHHHTTASTKLYQPMLSEKTRENRTVSRVLEPNDFGERLSSLSNTVGSTTPSPHSHQLHQDNDNIDL